MAATKKPRLPSRDTLLGIVKGVDVPPEWQGVETQEVKELEREAKRIRSELLRNPKLREIEKKAEKLRAAKLAKNRAARKRKGDLINRIKLAEVSPALVAEVRRFAGIPE